MLAFDFQDVPADAACVRIHQAGQAGYHEQKLECHSTDFPFPRETMMLLSQLAASDNRSS